MKKYSKIFVALLAVALLLCLATLTLTACDGLFGGKDNADFKFVQSNDGTYSLEQYNGKQKNVVIPDEYNGKAVTSIGESAFEFRADLSGVTIPDSVTSIGSYAFYNCTGLQTVTIGSGVTNIGDRAFSNCTGLQIVNWDATNCTEAGSSYNPTFDGCTGLTTINIGENVQSIPAYAFYGCTGLSEITIPNSVQSIGDWAFRFCTNLQTVNWNATNCTKAGNFDYPIFAYCTKLVTVNIGEDVQSIPDYAFQNCTGLQTVTIGLGVQSIGDWAFHCSGITKVNVASLKSWCGIEFSNDYANPLYESNLYNPGIAKLYLNDEEVTEVKDLDGLASIPAYAFYGLNNLTSVTIPGSVTSIGDSAFRYCTKITTATMPASAISYIPQDSLTSVTITSGKIGASAFWHTGLQTVTIGEGVQSIGSSAFSGCTGLQTVTIGEGVQSIGWYAFQDCAGLGEITIPNSVTSIGGKAFYNCYSIKELTVPKNVTSVGELAFGNMDNLMNIIWNAANCEITTTSSSGTRYGVFYGSAANIARVNRMNGVWVHIGSDCENIDDYTFAGLDIDTIFIDSNSSLNSIGDYAFAYCHTLREVNRSLNYVDVAETAFYNSTTVMNKLQNLDPNKLYYDVGGEGFVFYEESEHNFILVDYTVNGIANVLDLPKQIRINMVTYYNYKIGENAFAYRKDPVITIPSSVTNIDYYAFYWFSGTKVTLDGNTRVEERDNIIYEFVDDVPSILYVPKNIKGDVKILNGVTEIPAYAFQSCKDMKSITIPNSVTSIGSYAFNNCTGLTDIYYAGNATQWIDIKKSSYWDNNTPNYQLHYNSTGPENASAASNIATLPSEQAVLTDCDRLDLWAKQN